MYISCFWQSANANSQSPASKLFLRHPHLCIVLYLFTSVSPCQVSELCRSPVQSLPLQVKGTSALLLHQSPWCSTPFSATPVQFHTVKPPLISLSFGLVFEL